MNDQLKELLREKNAEVRYPDKINFYVDEEDILLGVPDDGTSCAVARSIRRSLYLAGFDTLPVTVSPRYVWVGARTYYHPYEEFVMMFDKGEQVYPFHGQASLHPHVRQ